MRMWNYLAAFWPYWWSLMGCAIFTILGVVAELFKKTPRWVTIVTFTLAIICFIPASYLAWKDEHDARIATENKLTSLTVPNFELQYSSLVAGNFRHEK